LGGAEQVRWLSIIEREHDNVLAALGWALEGQRVQLGLRLAVACAYFWQIRGHRFRTEGRRWLETLLAATPASIDGFQARALNWAATFAAEQSDYERAEALHAQALNACQQVGDRRGMAEA